MFENDLLDGLFDENNISLKDEDVFCIACLAIRACASLHQDINNNKNSLNAHYLNVLILRQIMPFLRDNKDAFLYFAKEKFNIEASPIFEAKLLNIDNNYVYH